MSISKDFFVFLKANLMGVGTTALPYEAMRREVTVTTNIAQPPNPGNQENPLVLGNSLSPPIVDEEVWNDLFSKYLVDIVSYIDDLHFLSL